MSSNVPVSGTLYVTVDGIQRRVRGNVKYSPHGVSRESMMGVDGYHGRKETHEPAYLECDITDAGDTKLKDFIDMQDVEVMAELANGKVFTMRNAAQMTKPENDPVEGQFTVRFEGGHGEEIS